MTDDGGLLVRRLFTFTDCLAVGELAVARTEASSPDAPVTFAGFLSMMVLFSWRQGG